MDSGPPEGWTPPLLKGGKLMESASGAVVATYREIADHFGLANPEKGRQKAKRAGLAGGAPEPPGGPSAGEGASRRHRQVERSLAAWVQSDRWPA